MSNFEVQILEPSGTILEIETISGANVSNIDIIQSSSSIIQINEDVVLLPSEFNTFVDAEIVNFISAGSGISLSSSPTGLIISSPLQKGSGIDLTYNSGIYIISSSGLQPSGNYSIVGHHHYSSDIDNFNSAVSGLIPTGLAFVSGANFISLLVNGIPVSLSGHQHLYSDISNFSDGISSNLTTSLEPGNNIRFIYNSGTDSLNISATGLQPSGNYSLVGHTHSSADITNFNSSVSGLLPIKDIISGSGISISSSSGNYTVSVTGNFGLTGEEVDDRVNSLLKPGSYINLDYNDNSDSLTINVTGLQVSGDYSLVGHSHLISDVSGLQNILDNKQPSGIYASGIHYHSASDVIDFNSSVSGLFPAPTFTSLSGLSGIIVNNSGTNYYVSLSDPTIQLADIIDLTSDVRTFLLSSSSSNFRNLVTDETGSGILVFNTNPSFSGVPTAPTAPTGSNNSQIANTAFVRNEISNLIDSAPNTLDTLNELAAALGDDPNFATTIVSGLGQKANLSGAIFTGAISGPSGDFTVLKQNGTIVSVSGHQHLISDITNFNSSFDSSDFSIISGIISVKVGGIDNNQLVNSSIGLGTTNMILGMNYSSLSGVIIDGGSP